MHFLQFQGSLLEGDSVICVTDQVEKVREIDVLKPTRRVWGHSGTSEAHLEPQGPQVVEVTDH